VVYRAFDWRELQVAQPADADDQKMEHIFLNSHDHLGIDYAMRRAELLGLGAPAELVQAVLATPLATDLRNGDFWRTVWLFLIANARAIGPSGS
jgi:hypothetical protein